VVGWSDWFNQVAALAYASITAATFLGALWAPAAEYARTAAVLVILAFTSLHWVGLRLGSSLTRLISIAIGLMMLILIVSCFLTPRAAASGATLPMAAASLPLLSLGMFSAVVTAFRAVLLTYDGWYSPIYLAEESTDPARTLPRAMIGGTVVLMTLYVLINIAMLRVLPLSALASSDLPAAAAARIVFPRGGAELVTVISLLTVLSLVNAVLLMTPRVLLAFGRDGLLTPKAAVVSVGGTPRVALAVSSAAGIALILSGTFEQSSHSPRCSFCSITSRPTSLCSC
jgi:basic amino acid/polyamine antiporter, APA family